MIQVEELRARARPRGSKRAVDVGPLTFTLEERESYALVGSESDGVDLVLSLLAGSDAPRSGKVTVAGAPASRRPVVAYAPYLPCLPEVLTVHDYLTLAAEVRKEPKSSPHERLATLGVASLGARRIDDLALDESRAVALVEALTSQATFVFLAEPLADLDPRAVGRVAEALHARVDAGATVVFSTASAADARALSREQLHLARGKLTHRTVGEEAWIPPRVAPDGRARLLIRSAGARLLLAELGADPTFAEVHGTGAELIVTGGDPVAMAAAVANASRHANVEIEMLTFHAASATGEAS
jgi:ABC-2 type transport system ATP-binding protein